MTTLHTLNATALQNPELAARLLRCTTHGDALLLLEDGTYNLSNPNFLQEVRQKNLALYAMTIDVTARGLQAWASNATATNDALFVELSCLHSKVTSWFP